MSAADEADVFRRANACVKRAVKILGLEGTLDSIETYSSALMTHPALYRDEKNFYFFSDDDVHFTSLVRRLPDEGERLALETGAILECVEVGAFSRRYRTAEGLLVTLADQAVMYLQGWKVLPPVVVPTRYDRL